MDKLVADGRMTFDQPLQPVSEPLPSEDSVPKRLRKNEVEYFVPKTTWRQDVVFDWGDPSGKLYLRTLLTGERLGQWVLGECLLEGTQLLEEDILRRWPLPRDKQRQPKVAALTPAPAQSGGRKGYENWDAIKLEAAVYMYRRKKAGSQSALIKHLYEWLKDPKGGPSLSQMKEHVAPIWRAFKQVDGK